MQDQTWNTTVSVQGFMTLCQSDQQHQQYNSTLFFSWSAAKLIDWHVPAYPKTHAYTPEFTIAHHKEKIHAQKARCPKKRTFLAKMQYI